MTEFVEFLATIGLDLNLRDSQYRLASLRCPAILVESHAEK